MASSISAMAIPASDAVQLLVSSLADESHIVREASAVSLKDIASLNPSLVLECCSTACRGGRRSFGNISGLFQVMAFAVQSLNKRDAEQSLMAKLARIAATEIVSSKELNADWQKAASALLVSIGSHFPDLFMEEIFVHITAPASALPAMVQVLADFASTDALQFAPRLKAVLSRVLPVLGNVRDAHRPIFANALGSWCQAAFQSGMDSQTPSVLDSDVISFLNSAFDLVLRVWTFSRDRKVQLSSVEALGQMVGVVSRVQLKLRIPALVDVMLELYKGDHESTFLATCSLHNLLNAILLSETGPPMLDFEEITVILSTLLTVVCIHNDINHRSCFSLGLKTYNEVQHCFMVVGFVYPEDLFLFLLSKCRLKEESITFGALCVLKHLLPRFSEVWHNKRSTLTETARLLLDEQSLRVQMALSELIVVMASHSYLVGPFMEMFIEHLVCNCSRKVDNDEEFSSSFVITRHKRMDVQIAPFSLRELRLICKKGLLLLAVTIPEMENILWPFLLKLIMPSAFTDAVATVCRCICELCRRKGNSSISVLYEGMISSGIPTSEEIFARMLVLLHDPTESDQIAMQILCALYYLAPLFPKNVKLLWRDEIPKLKLYIGDAEELKLNPSFQETWDDMIIDFLAETLDVIEDAAWLISLGNIFAKHYDLYAHDYEHCALLHRCFGMLLQKVDDKSYVHNMVDWMYKKANISCSINRLGLAKGMGLVAASHLDTVLDKLKDILEGMRQSVLKRIISFFYDRKSRECTDEVHAALALMYGYAARYAPSAVIKARVDALVGTNVLSHLLHVHHPTAKQALITAIDLLGFAVINAKESGYPFPLKRRDLLLDYVLTLMGGDKINDSSESFIERLHTQTLALSACTTLVSVQPKLSIETRNHVMKAIFLFFALPNEPLHSINPLVQNLITLFCAILDASGEDGGSRAEYFLYIMRQIDRFLSSSFNHQRRRGCMVAHALLVKFRSYCTSGYGHDRVRGLPFRSALCLGERIIVYLPRCADTDADVRKISVEILNLFFNISFSLPMPADLDLELSYDALSSLEDVVAIVRSDASIDSSEVFNRVISSVGLLLSKDELLATLHGCAPAICDRVKQSAEGAIQAVAEFVIRRGHELGETDISKTVQSLLSATGMVNEKNLRQEIFATISTVAENTSSGIVFHEVLSAAGSDLVTKDISRMLGGWPLQEVFCAFSQHNILSVLFLEYVVSILCCEPTLARKSGEEGTSTMDQIMQASVIGMTTFFRGGGKVGRKAVERNYSSILTTLLLQFGNCHGLVSHRRLEPLLDLQISFQAFCECVGDFEMGKVLERECDDAENENWVGIVGDIASCVSLKRTKEVSPICLTLMRHLANPLLCDAAAAALSEFLHYSRGLGSVLDEMVEALCQHASDDSPTIRRFCVRGLTNVPSADISTYSSQVLQVILASLQDSSEAVELSGLSCLLLVFDFLTKDAMKPYMSQLYRHVCNLQASNDPTIRANAFAAFGTLSSCGVEENPDDLVELIHSALPRLILHLGDEDPAVCKACRSSLIRSASQIEWKELGMLDSISFESDCRSDYEKFIRDLIRKSSRQFALRFEKYIAVAMQAFDAPWPIIQANAVHFASSILSISHDEQMVRAYFTEIFRMLVDKLNRSSDAVVRAACSAAIALLMRSLKLSPPRSA